MVKHGYNWKQAEQHKEGVELDPIMVAFLLAHPLARSVVYGMMKNAATTRDDPEMIAWYKPVEEAKEARPTDENVVDKLWEAITPGVVYRKRKHRGNR